MEYQLRMPSKRDLGVGYLAGASLALITSLLAYLWFTRQWFLAASLVVTMGVVLFSAIAYIGYVFYDIGIADEFIWTVAKGVAIGFTLAIVFAASIAYVWSQITVAAVVAGLIVMTIATWVVLGALLGVISGMRTQHNELMAVNRRNSVMNRVLRHNIKNTMNIIRGQADILVSDVDDPPQRSVDAIDRAVDEILSLSEAARKIDSMKSAVDDGPVDLARLVREYADNARETYPEIELTVNAPEPLWAEAGPILRSAIQNVVENAVEHHDGEVPVQVTISTTEVEDGWVVLRVADNGPGIPEREREVLFAAGEEPTYHGVGLGLWLVRWIIDHFDGRLSFESNDPRGSIVNLRLKAADPPPDNRGSSIAGRVTSD